jgi:ATP synthase subunit 6
MQLPIWFRQPLDQFELVTVSDGYFSITNLNVSLLSAVLTIIYVCLFAILGSFFSSIAVVLDSAYKFISSIFEKRIMTVRKEYSPILFFLFLFIAVSNLIGLMPYTFTATSSLGLIITLTVSFYVGSVFIGFYLNQWYVTTAFLPLKDPNLLSFGLFLLELIAFFSKPMSLGLRLLANMVAGHTLIKIIGAALFQPFYSLNGWGMILSIVPALALYAVLCGELFIAGLQAYIFVTLVSMYINDNLNLR